jgi:hypothetical protein
MRPSLAPLAKNAALVERWVEPVEHDLLAIARVVEENSYTELLAWALRPGTHEPSARRRQQEWLASLETGLRHLAARGKSRSKPVDKWSFLAT